MSDKTEHLPVNMSQEILLNAGDVARILKCSKQFVHKLIRLGKIRAIRMGKFVRVRQVDLEAFIRSSVQGLK